MVVMDWAMKFLQKKYREKQSKWFGKRGINWHVSCVILKNTADDSLQVQAYVHLFDSSGLVHRLRNFGASSHNHQGKQARSQSSLLALGRSGLLPKQQSNCCSPRPWCSSRSKSYDVNEEVVLW